MGGAQPLAVTMNGGVALCVEVDPIAHRAPHQDPLPRPRDDDLDEAAARGRSRRAAAGEAVSIGLVGNCADVLPELLRRGFRPDIVTDQTSAHDPLGGYVPAGLSLEEAAALRASDPEAYQRRAQASMAAHCDAMVGFQEAGALVFDYGNNLRAGAELGGLAHERAYAYPGFVPAFVRPMFCEGKGPFRWAALSGDPEDIVKTDRAVAELFPENERLRRWLDLAEERVAFQGLPARICWLGYGERAKAGLRFNEMVASGELAAPIVIGRDHLDSGSVASPYRETEGMRDGSDAIADWPILNALVNTAAGAHWVSVHHGGGVGIGYSIHAGMVVVADGSPEAAERLRACPHDRPRDGRRPTRGRRLRAGARGRARARGPTAGDRLSRDHDPSRPACSGWARAYSGLERSTRWSTAAQIVFANGKNRSGTRPAIASETIVSAATCTSGRSSTSHVTKTTSHTPAVTV